MNRHTSIAFHTIVLALCLGRFLTASSANAAIPAVTPSGQNAADTIAADSISGTYNLEELEIVSVRRLVQSDGAKLTYNVSEDPERASSPILEILRKVPGVTVDAEDNVRVNGKTNFRILLNNHDDALLQGDIKTVLKSLPASSIKKIEVISKPDAKYDAEGWGGILNFVTEQNTRLEGFLAQLSAYMTSRGGGGSVYARGKLGNTIIGANVSVQEPFGIKNSNKSESRTEDLADNNVTLSNQRAKFGNPKYLNTQVNGSWEPDTANLFTFGISFSQMKNPMTNTETRALYTSDMDMLWQVERFTDFHNRYLDTGGNISYQHTFGQAHTLVGSYMFMYGRNTTDATYTVISQEGSLHEMPFMSKYKRTKSFTHIGQIDYSNHIGGQHLVEAGAKMSLVHDDGFNLTHQGLAPSESSVIQGSEMNLTQHRDIFALYASYTATFGRYHLKAGVRYEHTRMGLDYHTPGYESYMRHLNDVVPDVAVTRSLTQASSLRLSWSARISRPGLSYLNPYVDTSIPGQLSYGNPGLKSGHTNNVALSYSNYDHPLSGSAEIGYRFSRNGISDIVFYHEGILNSTYANVGHERNPYGELNLNWNPSRTWSAMLWYGVNYADYRAHSELLDAHRCGWQQTVNVQATYTAPFGLRASAYGGWWSPWIDLQSRGSDGYFYGLGLSRSFLAKDAMRLSLSAANFLPAWHKNSYTQESETVRLRHNSRYQQWSVNFSVSWTIGSLKADVKSTAAKIQMETTAAGSSNK